MYVLWPISTMIFSGRLATHRLKAPMRSCAQQEHVYNPMTHKHRQHAASERNDTECQAGPGIGSAKPDDMTTSGLHSA